MKKLLSAILGIFLFASIALGATWYSISSNEQTASANIYASACYVAGLHIMTDGTNDAVVMMYDSATTTTTHKIIEFTVVGADNYGGKVWRWPVKVEHGIYVTVSGTGASYIVEYVLP